MGWTGINVDPPERDLDPENPYADPAALLQHRQQKVREKLVRIERAKVPIPPLHRILSYAAWLELAYRTRCGSSDDAIVHGQLAC